MHDFSAADWGYGFGLPIIITPEYMSEIGRVHRVVVGGAAGTRFHHHELPLSNVVLVQTVVRSRFDYLVTPQSFCCRLLGR